MQVELITFTDECTGCHLQAWIDAHPLATIVRTVNKGPYAMFVFFTEAL